MMNNKMPASPPKNDWSIQRRWKRYRVEVRLKVYFQQDGAQTFTSGQGSDISEGGMAAYVPMELNPGDTVELELMFPYSKDPVHILAAIRNRNGFRFGLEFTRILPSDRDILVRSLKALALVQ